MRGDASWKWSEAVRSGQKWSREVVDLWVLSMTLCAWGCVIAPDGQDRRPLVTTADQRAYPRAAPSASSERADSTDRDKRRRRTTQRLAKTKRTSNSRESAAPADASHEIDRRQRHFGVCGWRYLGKAFLFAQLLLLLSLVVLSFSRCPAPSLTSARRFLSLSVPTPTGFEIGIAVQLFWRTVAGTLAALIIHLE